MPAPPFTSEDVDWFNAAAHVDAGCKGYQGVTVATYGGVTKIIFTPYGSQDQPLGYLLAYNPSYRPPGGGDPFFDKNAYECTDLASTVDPSAQGFLGGFADENGWFYLPPFMKNTGAATEDNGVFVRWNFTGPIEGPSAQYETFDITSMPQPPTGIGWATGAYDGHQFVYFVPVSRFSSKQPHGCIVRYDTAGRFVDPASWASFDLQANELRLSPRLPTNLRGQAAGFQSNALIGGWLYLVPFGFGYSVLVRLRLDDNTPFDQANSYQWVDLAGPALHREVPNLYAVSRGFTGTVVNGDYLYLVPWRDLSKTQTQQSQSVIGRFNLAAQRLNDPSAWQFYDLANTRPSGPPGNRRPLGNALARGYQGGATNGQFLYLTPTANFAINAPPPFARWDCSQRFTDPAAWTFVESTGAPPMTLAEAYRGYVYMSPYGVDRPGELRGEVHRIRMQTA